MELVLIHQNDTHGCLDTHPEFFWGDPRPFYIHCGGFSRIFRYVTRLKQQHPHVLFVDGGDLFHGTGPLVLSKGEAVLPLLRQMPLDAWVPGNWDFAYGPQQLFSLISQVPAPALAMNAKPISGKVNPFHSHMIREIGGIRVGLTGWTYPFVDQTMPPSFSEGFTFSLNIDDMRKVVHQLREKERADLIVVISHMGLPLDIKVASCMEGIDIILSGHSHDRIDKPIRQNNTWIVQSGASASFLGRIDISFENGKITHIRHQLIPLYADEYEEDLEFSRLIREIKQPYETLLHEEIGKLKTPLHRMFLNETPMDRLITDAYLYAIDADIALSHGWRYGAPILPGVITVEDLYQIIPTNPELFTLELEGRFILEAFETNLEQVFSPDPFQQKGGYVLRTSGVIMAYKPYNPKGRRIEHFLVQNKPLKQDAIYRIVSAGEQILGQYQSVKKHLGIHAHDAIRHFFQAHQTIEIHDTPRIFSIEQ